MDVEITALVIFKIKYYYFAQCFPFLWLLRTRFDMFNGPAHCMCTNGKLKRAHCVPLADTPSKSPSGATNFDVRVKCLKDYMKFENLQYITLAFCQHKKITISWRKTRERELG